MTVNSNRLSFYRLPFLLVLVGTILLTVAILHQTAPPEWTDSLTKIVKPRPSKSFYDIALSHGTDKVTDHNYHHIYQKYLEPIRNRPLKFLEIGLGCDMDYGPGASLGTWLEYLPNVDLYYIEFDGKCAEKWANKTSGAAIFVGDQSDARFLNRFLAEVGPDFDVIVDDGGHTMNQQITSLFTLWKAVVPGGLYICEDLQTSYFAGWGGNPHNEGKLTTMMSTIKELLDDLNSIPGDLLEKHKFSREILSVDCMTEVCAFTKKDAVKERRIAV